MKKYIDNLEIQDEEKIKKEITEWKDDILKKCYAQMKTSNKWLGIGFLLAGLISFIITYILSVRVDPVNGDPQSNYFSFAAPAFIGLVLVIIGSVFAFKHSVNKAAFTMLLIIYIDINPIEHWFPEINENIKVDNNSDLYIQKSNENNYRKMKYEVGTESKGLIREYRINEGTIFDNPYYLTCGIWKSTSNNNTVYESYLPLLKIETNLFENQVISITNDRFIFPGFTNKDIQLEDNEFNKIFSMKTTDENALRMILTPLVQNKWKEIKGLPSFKLHIEDGIIMLSFNPMQSFMDYEKISELSLKEFKKIDVKIMNDYKRFLAVLDLIFSISIFQFENSNKYQD